MVTSHITDRISGTWATSLMLHNRRRRNFRFWNGCDTIQDGGGKRKLRLRLLWSIKLVAYTTYINFKNWPTLWPGDVIDDVMNTDLYKCSHNFMIPKYRKFDDDIFVHFSYHEKCCHLIYKGIQRADLGPCCNVIDDAINIKNILLA